MATQKKNETSQLNQVAESKKDVPLKMIEESGRYRIGAPKRPDIKHDNGFLDKFATREPTLNDRAVLAKWKIMLQGAELFRNDLSDATAAYSHFLNGNGTDRTLDYERYIANDKSGAITIKSIIADAQKHIEIIGEHREDFEVTSKPYTPGPSGGAQFPTPSTENWQKAIGAHFVWVSAQINLSLNASHQPVYSARLTFHVEDRYNFNPGQKDIATGIPDSENGRFEITGLGKQYTHYSKIYRTVSWAHEKISNTTVISGSPATKK